jgi:hypothetical protein
MPLSWMLQLHSHNHKQRDSSHHNAGIPSESRRVHRESRRVHREPCAREPSVDIAFYGLLLCLVIVVDSTVLTHWVIFEQRHGCTPSTHVLKDSSLLPRPLASEIDPILMQNSFQAVDRSTKSPGHEDSHWTFPIAQRRL